MLQELFYNRLSSHAFWRKNISFFIFQLRFDNSLFNANRAISIFFGLQKIFFNPLSSISRQSNPQTYSEFWNWSCPIIKNKHRYNY
ncbi:unnamed protein product [Blepharisma stoltei]|uniref:Uncharacterized protein n=1 Tax=Blepharisma stoltei TaxID=1481888 RepID=A0AAU9J554_9CILI|nr:unnamed protein product [Blepharisma stoltei]